MLNGGTQRSELKASTLYFFIITWPETAALGKQAKVLHRMCIQA